MYMSDLLNENYASTSLAMTIRTTNPLNPDKKKATQYLPLMNVFMNYLVDLDLLARGKPFEKTIISFNFW